MFKPKTFAFDKEFKIGNHKIGWMNSRFTEAFSGKKFKQSSLPKCQKLSRRMTDAQIESELKPGLCTPADILAFLENPRDEWKDGNWNLFYTEAFVVSVCWYAGFGFWCVCAWGREYDWFAGGRVFSPATDRSAPSELGSLTLRPSAKKLMIEIMATLELDHKALSHPLSPKEDRELKNTQSRVMKIGKKEFLIEVSELK